MKAMSVIPGQSWPVIAADVAVQPAADGEILVEDPGEFAICRAGMSSGRHGMPLNPNQVNARVVPENVATFGTVRLISRRVPLSSWPSASVKTPDDVTVAVDLRE